MSKKINIIFCCLTAALFFVPLLYLAGVEENFMQLNGVEEKITEPSFSFKRFWSKKFQEEFERYVGMNFFLRKSFLKTKNQLFEWANAGFFHSGYSERIITGKENHLFEKVYLEFYFHRHIFSLNPHHAKHFQMIRKLEQEMKKIGIDFVYVLAPDKFRMYPELLPWHFSFMLKPQASQIFEPYSNALKQYKITHLDAYSFLKTYKGKVDLYPRRGTHWNAKAAYMVVDRILRDLNKNKEPGKKYPQLPKPEFVSARPPRYADNDLQELLNVFCDPKRYNKGLVPRFPKVKPHCGEVIVMGDSFANQLAVLLKDSGCFSKVHNYQNYMPSVKRLEEILPRTRLFLLVYTTKQLFVPTRYWHWQLLYASAKKVRPGTVFLGNGFYPPEHWGAWSRKTATASICLPEIRQSENVRLYFENTATATMKYTEVYYQGKKVAHWDYPRNLQTTLFLKVPVKEQSITLEFRNFDPYVPAQKGGSSDTRLLGLGIQKIIMTVDRNRYHSKLIMR